MQVDLDLSGVERYLEGASEAVRGRALVAGVRAYLTVLRRAAQDASPYDSFRQAKRYRMAARLGRGGAGIQGYMFAGGQGNILQGGAVEHYAPIGDTINQKTGSVFPGLRQWLARHAPELVARWGPKAEFAKVAARAGRPWVIPAAEAAQGAAEEAFEGAVLDAMLKAASK